MKSYGIGLLVVGAVTSLSALLFINTALPGTEVINLGRVQIQAMLFQGGCALFVAGAILVAAGRLATVIAAGNDRATAIPVVGISAAIAGTISALLFTFGGQGSLATPETSGEPLVAMGSNNADALADQMETEADRLDALADNMQ